MTFKAERGTMGVAYIRLETIDENRAGVHSQSIYRAVSKRSQGLAMSETIPLQLCGFEAEKQELDFRQREVLSALSEDTKATYSFQGLRRKLGFHQEMLSRTLDRLEQEQLVQKTKDGYRINSSKNTSQLDSAAELFGIETQVISAHLPAQSDPDLILNTLKGRWFGEFRWLGYSRNSRVLVLSWITEDGRIQLRARIARNTLAISAVNRSTTDEERAARSAFELFDFVTRHDSLSVRHELLN